MDADDEIRRLCSETVLLRLEVSEIAQETAAVLDRLRQSLAERDALKIASRLLIKAAQRSHSPEVQPEGCGRNSFEAQAEGNLIPERTPDGD